MFQSKAHKSPESTQTHKKNEESDNKANKSNGKNFNHHKLLIFWHTMDKALGKPMAVCFTEQIAYFSFSIRGKNIHQANHSKCLADHKES